MFESFLNCDLALVSDLLYFLKKAPKFVNPRRYGGKRGGGWLPPHSEVLYTFFLDNKTSAPHVFSSCSSIPRPHFETSLVMVSNHGYEI